ncbi:hypothetical protein Ahy_B04g070474 isoform H [Arachis hypogaea]|nr:hypothetical protein Ahy_B04g070474 isoform H [Arachis hypogaea]
MREIFETLSNPFQLLFAAVEVGNFGFLSEILSAYPDLIRTKDNSTDQTIIHKAVMHRHASIFNLIHEIGSLKDTIVTMMDTEGNTLLHLAAKRAPPQRQLELVSGAAFQMCLELVWFKVRINKLKICMSSIAIIIVSKEGLRRQHYTTSIAANTFYTVD